MRTVMRTTTSFFAFLFSLLVASDAALATGRFVLATGRRDPRIYAIDFDAALLPQNDRTPNAIVSRSKVQVVPTFNTSFTFTPPSPGKNKTVRATAHSVAVDSHNNHALVPLPANNVFPNCLNGCIAIYGTE